MHIYKDQSKKILWILSQKGKQEEKMFGKQTKLLEMFCRTAKTCDIGAYVVTLKSVNTLLKNKKEVYGEGYAFHSEKWKYLKVKKPDIIFDRYYSDIRGFKKEDEEIKLILYRNGYVFVNPPGLSENTTDKLKFFLFCKKNGIRTPRILGTWYPGKGSIFDLIKFHVGKRIIIKPRFGRMGRGIFIISWKENEISIKNSSVSITCSTKYEVEGALEYFSMIEKLYDVEFIVQKFVNSSHKLKRMFDIRFLIQRDGMGKMGITGEYARIQGRKTNVSNLSCGGYVLPVPDALRKIFSRKESENILKTCRKKAFDVYGVLERKYGLIGELGIDLLIDKYGRAWILEVNSKPGRFGLQRLSEGFGLTKAERNSFKRKRKISIEKPLQFGYWLSQKRKLINE